MKTQHIDKEFLNNATGGSAEMIMTLAEIFREQIPEFTEKMETCLSQKNYLELSRVAHTAKSSCAYLGITELRDKLERLEINTKTGANSEEFVSIVADFKRIANESMTELEEIITTL